jgi:hypothetical protein
VDAGDRRMAAERYLRRRRYRPDEKRLAASVYS